MLDFFSVSSVTDGGTRCRIHVEPAKRKCAVTVTVDGRIVRMADETDATFRSYGYAEWSSIEHWDRRAHELARQFSPFWHPPERIAVSE